MATANDTRISAKIIQFRPRASTPQHGDQAASRLIDLAETISRKRVELLTAIDRAPRSFFVSNQACSQNIHNCLRVRFSVNSVAEIPGEDLDEAIAIVKLMERDCEAFTNVMHEIRNAFIAQVFRGGEPWTAHIRRKLKRRLGERPDWRALAAELQK